MQTISISSNHESTRLGPHSLEIAFSIDDRLWKRWYRRWKIRITLLTFPSYIFPPYGWQESDFLFRGGVLFPFFPFLLTTSLSGSCVILPHIFVQCFVHDHSPWLIRFYFTLHSKVEFSPSPIEKKFYFFSLFLYNDHISIFPSPCRYMYLIHSTIEQQNELFQIEFFAWLSQFNSDYVQLSIEFFPLTDTIREVWG